MNKSDTSSPSMEISQCAPDVENKTLLEQLISDWRRERPDVDTANKGIIYAIYLLERSFRKRTERILSPIGLKFGDYTVLACLRRAGSPYRLQPGTLAELLDLTSGGVSQTLQKLEDRKLVTRTRNPVDNRQISVALTKKGKALVDQAFSHLTDQENAIMYDLSDEDREQLQSNLGNLIARFKVM